MRLLFQKLSHDSISRNDHQWPVHSTLGELHWYRTHIDLRIVRFTVGSQRELASLDEQIQKMVFTAQCARLSAESEQIFELGAFVTEEQYCSRHHGVGCLHNPVENGLLVNFMSKIEQAKNVV